MKIKELKNITVIGMGLLGGSVSLAVSRCLPEVEVVGYAHRPATRAKARAGGLVPTVTDNLHEAVRRADLVILATPVCTFETLFSQMADDLPDQCIVTDVGSTKVLAHQWAATHLPRRVFYVGSHPMAGSEQRGLEFARDDLFDRTCCLVTHKKSTPTWTIQAVTQFWERLGCAVTCMSPTKHDRIVAHISHVPHLLAVGLINTTREGDLDYAGKGFVDTSRIASGPANVWADIFLTNATNVCRGLDGLIAKLNELRRAVENEKRAPIERLLNKARDRRARMIRKKIHRKELLE